MKKNNNKGFTLVELIVVLVILAILAAILVPALLGYIDRAREKQYVLNAKSALTAAQAELSSLYGEDTNKITAARTKTIWSTADVPGREFYVYTSAQLKNDTKADSTNHASYTIAGAVYHETDNVYLAFNGKSWTSYATKDEAEAAITAEGIASANKIAVWSTAKDGETDLTKFTFGTLNVN